MANLTLYPGKMYRDTEGIVYQILAIGRRNGKDVAFALARVGDQDGVYEYALNGKLPYQNELEPDYPSTLVEEVTAWDVQVYLTRAPDGAVTANLGTPVPGALASGSVRLSATKDQIDGTVAAHPAPAGRVKTSRRRSR